MVHEKHILVPVIALPAAQIGESQTIHFAPLYFSFRECLRAVMSSLLFMPLSDLTAMSANSSMDMGCFFNFLFGLWIPIKMELSYYRL